MTQRIEVPDKSPEQTPEEYVGAVRAALEMWLTKMLETLFVDIEARRNPLLAQQHILQLHGYGVSHPTEDEPMFLPRNTLKSYRAHFKTSEEAWLFCWDDYKERSPK